MKTLSKLLATFSILFHLHTVALAQAAHPELFGVASTKGVHLTMDFYSDLNFGNLSQYNTNINPTISYHSGKFESVLEGHFNLGSFDNELWLNQHELTLRGIYQFMPKIGFDMFSLHQTDNLINLTYRHNVGLGLRMELFNVLHEDNTSKNALFLGFNSLFESDKFDVDHVVVSSNLMRLGAYLSHLFNPTEQLLWSLSAHVIITPHEPQNWRHTLKSEVNFALSETTYISKQIMYRFDNNSVITVKKFDFFGMIGIGWKF